MNEETKHIESCRSEDPLAQTMEACGNENDLQAALQPLLVETMPGYVPVPTTAPTSPIAELPNVLISIIRRVATKPLTMFGDRPAKQSLLGTLLDTWNAIRQRLSGNPSLGIPDRRAEMTSHSLPTALALLNDRKISGVPEAVDGMSVLHLIGNTNIANSITILNDPNKGYVWNRERFNTNYLLMNMLFPNLQEVHIGCGRNTQAIFVQNTNIQKIVFEEMVENDAAPFWITSYDGGFPNLTEVSFPKLKVGGSLIYWNLSGWWNNGLLGLTTLNLPELETIKSGAAIGNAFISGTMPSLEILNMPKLKTLNSYLWGGYTLSGLKELHMPSLTHCNSPFTNTTYAGSPADLILVEVGAVETNMDIRYWSPTNVLADADKTATFLSNFRDYIAKRLANQTGLSKLTLTLSANVFSAVFTNESGSTEEIVARNAIRDEIRGEITDRNWKVTDSTNNFNN